MTAEVDVVAPCALGGVLNDETVPALRCRAIAGAANNQLADDALDAALAERGILWAPDFVCNAGGIINICVELEPEGYAPDRADARVRAVGDTLRQIFDTAAAEPARRRCGPRYEIGRERLSSVSRPSSRSFSRCARSVIAANGRTAAGASSQAASSSPSSSSSARLERGQQLALALGAVGEVLVELRRRVGHLVAVAGADPLEVQRAQAPQPVEVLAQAAADEHAALAEHGVAGERGAAGDEHQVVVGVAGDVRARRTGRTCRRRAASVAAHRHVAEPRAQRLDALRVVGVRVRERDPARAAARRDLVRDGVQMRVDRRARDRRPRPGRGRRPRCSSPRASAAPGSARGCA